MSVAPQSASLVGRDAELQVLGRAVGGIRDRGGAVVVRGEAGIGKSALLAAASRSAASGGVRVLRTAGVESETRIVFAGLHQLLRPVVDQVASLPGPQRGAVAAALGRAEAVTPDLFLIALGTLNLVSEAAVPAPVLLVVEDVQWLDRASADVLAFVARRLEFERVVLLAAVRDGFPSSFDDAGLPELSLGRLDRPQAAVLLDAGSPGLGPAVRERVLAEAAGNPLALVELPSVVGRLDDGAASMVTMSWLPLTTRLEQAFAARVSGLPTAARLLLLVAALNDGELLPEIVAAAVIVAGEELTVDDLAPAVDARLVRVEGGQVSFVHPLMRSAIHQRASLAQRQRVHAALARVLGSEIDRRVWHRAASVTGPDEDVAAELAAAAARARRRGGLEAAVAALERAVRLSGDPGRQGERLLRAAELAFELGRPHLVGRLLGQAEPIELSERQRSRLVWIRDRFDDGIRDPGAGARALTDLAERVADADTGFALKLLWGAALRCFWSDPGQAARDRVVTVAERLDVDPHDGRLLAILAYAAPIERGAVVVDRLSSLVAHESTHTRAARLADAAILLGAFDLGLGFSTTAIGGLRAQGRLGVLARCLTMQALCATHVGDLSVAIPAAEEASRLTRETMQPIMHATARAGQAMLAALRDEQDHVEEFAGEAERAALPVAAAPVMATVQHARGLAALGGGRYAEACEHLRRLYDPADPAYHLMLRCYAIGDLVEASVYSGQKVDGVVREMELVARRTTSPVLHAGLRYARALLADDGEAEELFDTALRADLVRWPFARARVQLAYGGWLRRRRRAADSRAYLRAARETFDALGIAAWGERARRELRASGETSRRRTPDARDRLTPQELQIAQLAAGGLTNREIGEKLYLSPRTIGSHLHRIFPKLGITTRAALGRALDPGLGTVI